MNTKPGRETGEKNVMINSVKGGREIKKRQEICFEPIAFVSLS